MSLHGRLRIGLWLGVGVGVLALGACGGGGGSPVVPEPVAPVDLSGWWIQENEDMNDPQGLRAVQLVVIEDEGETVLYEGRRLTRTGRTLRHARPSELDPDRYEVNLEVLTPNRLTGVDQRFDEGVRMWGRSLRLTRTSAPHGSFSMNGSVLGHAVAVESATAHATDHEDFGAYTIVTLHDSHADSDTNISFGLQAFPVIPVGTYDVGSASDEVSVFAWAGRGSDFGVGGNVVFTESTSSRVVGYYIVALDSGDTVTGSFDAPVRVSGPWPW